MSVLTGKTVLITRAAHQSAKLANLLQQAGAIPLLYPCIEIRPPQNTQAFDEALYQLAHGKFQWLIITSANTAYSIAERLNALQISLPNPQKFQIAAVGPSTADAVKKHLNLNVEVVPPTYTASALAQSLTLEPDTSILLPQSEIADGALISVLNEMQVNLTTVTAYQNSPGHGGIHLLDYLQSQVLHAITFTSSSTVTNFIQRLQNEGGDINQLKEVCIACIGPKTATTAQADGLNVNVVPRTHTLEALVDALQEYFTRQKVSPYDYK